MDDAPDTLPADFFRQNQGNPGVSTPDVSASDQDHPDTLPADFFRTQASDTTTPPDTLPADFFRQKQGPDAETPPDVSTIGATTGEAALSAAPAGGGILGGLLGGAAVGTVLEPGLGTLAGGVAGAFAGAWSVQKAQDAVLDKLGLSKGVSDWQKAAEEQHPIASTVGGALPYFAGGTPGRALALGERATSAAVNAAITAGSEVASGNGLEPGQIATNAALGAALPFGHEGAPAERAPNLKEAPTKPGGDGGTETFTEGQPVSNRSDLKNPDAGQAKADSAKANDTPIVAGDVATIQPPPNQDRETGTPGGAAMRDENRIAKTGVALDERKDVLKTPAGEESGISVGNIDPTTEAVLTADNKSSETVQTAQPANQPANAGPAQVQPAAPSQVHPAVQAAIEHATGQPPQNNQAKPTLTLRPKTPEPAPAEPVHQAVPETPASKVVTAPVTPKPFVYSRDTQMGAEPPKPFAHPALSEQDQALLHQFTNEAYKQRGPQWTAKFQQLPIERQLAAAHEVHDLWTQHAAAEPAPPPAAVQPGRKVLQVGENPVQTGGGERDVRKNSALNAMNQVFQKYGPAAGHLDPNDKGAAIQRATAALKEANQLHPNVLDRKEGYRPNTPIPQRDWLAAAQRLVRNPGSTKLFNEFLGVHSSGGIRDPDMEGELSLKRRPNVDTVTGTVPTEQPKAGRLPKTGVAKVIKDAMSDEGGWGPAFKPRTAAEKIAAGLKRAEAAKEDKQADEVQRQLKATNNRVAETGYKTKAVYDDIAKYIKTKGINKDGKLLASTGQDIFRAFEPHGEDFIKKFSPEQKAIYDKLKPVYDAGNRDYEAFRAMRPDLEMPPKSEGFIRRIYKGTRGWDEGADPILDSNQPTRGLSTNNPAQNERVFMTAEDKQGNRILLAMGDKDPDGDQHIVSWDKGKMEDLGVAQKDMKFQPGQKLNFNNTDYELTHAQAREINEHARVDPKENNGNPRYEIHEDPLTSIFEHRMMWKRSLEHQEALNSIIGNKHLNANGQPIQSGEDKYPPDPRMMDYISTKPKEGFEESSLPQTKGFYFTPNVKAVLDNYHRAGFGSWGALDKIEKYNRSLTKLMFLSPVFHGLNDLQLWGARQGWKLASPTHWKNAMEDIPDAVKDVTQQGAITRRIMNAGGSLEYWSSLHRDIMGDVARMAGLGPEMKYGIGKRAIDGIYDTSSHSMWYANDVMYTHLFITATKRMGLSDEAAVKWVENVFPNYQAQRKIFGSRFVAKALADGRLALFGRYRGGVLKQYENVFGDVVKAVRDKDAEAGNRAAGYLFGTAVMALVSQQILNGMAQLVSGEPDATVGYHGNMTIPGAIFDALNGNAGGQTYTKALKDIWTLPPIPRAAEDLWTNTNFAGKPIVQPQDAAPFDSGNRTAGERARDALRGLLSAGEHTATQLIPPLSVAENIMNRSEQGQGALRQLADYMLDIKTKSPKTQKYEAKKVRLDNKEERYRERHPQGTFERVYDALTS